jgi:hypothetical protein
MRKRLIGDDQSDSDEQWLDLDSLAQVAITSEEADHPIESALTGMGSGWRASSQGEQVIRLLFDEPLSVSRIRVGFEESAARTQEFVLRWSPDRGGSYREIVRQQYTFSPPDTTREIEDYTVNLGGVTLLELRILPDIQGGTARASLKQLRVKG